MPCSERKARLLLKTNKAVIKYYNPFAIQLLYPSGETVQSCSFGIDTGSRHIGIAITSADKVILKGEIELRQDVSSNIYERRVYRRNRRERKTRYRKSRFLNRKRKEKWLPPSLENRIQHTFRWIDKLQNFIPSAKIRIEVGKFDASKMKNPDIQGKGYQDGKMYEFYNNRYFVFARDNYTCQCCGKSVGKILQTHHILYRSNGGSNSVDNLITVCTDCHIAKNHKPGGILYEWQKEKKKVRQYKEPPFMNILRKRTIEKYKNSVITYGSITALGRKKMNLSKTHYNDAIIISGIQHIKENPEEWLLIRQFRKKKRILHEAIPRKGKKKPNTSQKRNNKHRPYYKGFYLNDKVFVDNREGYITGFASTCAYLKDENNDYIVLLPKTYKQICVSKFRLICHNNNWQYIMKKEGTEYE